MCILPGQDPCGEVAKECQDGLFVIDSNGALLAALFDGHGTKGEDIVAFCLAYLKKYFQEHMADFEARPANTIEHALLSCNDALDRSPDIDSNMAGTTAVVVYINGSGIHVGSVGDSRCILGSTIDQVVRSERHSVKPKTEVTHSTFKRKIEDIPQLLAIPLSTDQKPNHEGEMERILQAGGKVARLLDENGKRVGPYRVWNATGQVPGLAMSRSLGDRVAHSAGVSASPIVESFTFDPNDKFIVIASDGVWDVMENKDVANLVERNRRRCKRNTIRGFPKRVRAADCLIAHLLALEARYRWLDVVQEEDVMIDDISVIVIELEDLPTTSTLPSLPNRKSVMRQSMAHADEHKPAIHAPKSSSPVEAVGGVATARTQRLSVSRKDKVRGSMVLNEDERAMLAEEEEDIRAAKKRK